MRHAFVIASCLSLACVPARATEGKPVPSVSGASPIQVAPSRPQVSIPADKARVETALGAYDATAVAAARHYYGNPLMRSSMLGMVDSMVPALVASVEKQSAKPLDPSTKAKLGVIFNEAFAENYDYLLDANMLVILQVMDKEQIVALDAFYSSPVGQAIVERMPQVGAHAADVMQAFMPPFMASVQARMTAAGIK